MANRLVQRKIHFVGAVFIGTELLWQKYFMKVQS